MIPTFKMVGGKSLGLRPFFLCPFAQESTYYLNSAIFRASKIEQMFVNSEGLFRSEEGLDPFGRTPSTLQRAHLVK